MNPSKNEAMRLAARISSGNPAARFGTICMKSSRRMAPTAPPTNTARMILIMATPLLTLRTGNRGPKPCGQNADHDRKQQIGQRNHDPLFSGQFGGTELHAAERGVAAEQAG